MKKKVVTMMALMAAMICLAAPFTVYAEDLSAGTTGQEISVVIAADPTYTVTIPESVTMGNDGTTVDVVAEDVENIPAEQKIVVTVAGTNYYRNQMILEADTSPKTSLRYQIISESGETIETLGGKDQANGKEVVSFTENGTKQYTIKPVIAGKYEKGVPYSGSITFGIALTEVQ